MAFNPSQSCNSYLSTCATGEPLADVIRQIGTFGASSNQAAQLSFTAATPAAWVAPPPTTIGEAVNRIADFIYNSVAQGPIP